MAPRHGGRHPSWQPLHRCQYYFKEWLYYLFHKLYSSEEVEMLATELKRSLYRDETLFVDTVMELCGIAFLSCVRV